MKDYHIYLFDNIENLDKTIGFVNIKEKFIDNSFVEEAYVLLNLSEDFSSRKEIPLKYIEKHLVKGQGFSVPQFSSKYAKEIQSINNYIDKNGNSLSWLEIFQIARLISGEGEITDLLIKEAISRLAAFSSIISEKY